MPVTRLRSVLRGVSEGAWSGPMLQQDVAPHLSARGYRGHGHQCRTVITPWHSDWTKFLGEDRRDRRALVGGSGEDRRSADNFRFLKRSNCAPVVLSYQLGSARTWELLTHAARQRLEAGEGPP